MHEFQKIGVAGAGAWGLALANAAIAAGRDVALWGRDEAMMRALERDRRSAKLPGVELARGVVVGADPAILSDVGAVLVATPAQTTREAVARLADLPGEAPFIACAKGVERGRDLFMTEVLAEISPSRATAILSGPSFASDVAAGLPTAVTLASADDALARALACALSGPTLRLYHSTDVRGVEIGGAAKNVLAIACGVAAGRGLGASAIAALTARGFAELRRFGEAFGARPATLMGLSGLGDLVLTCATLQSRNFAYGHALGRGAPPSSADGGKLAEGALTAQALMGMARRAGVDMPISACVEALVAGAMDVPTAIGALLGRPLKREE